MKERFIIELRDLAGEVKKNKFLLAVSGGIDSCVLAHLFFTHRLSFDIAHCNFHLRGNDSNLDEQFVTDLARKYSCHLHHTEFDTIGIQKNSGKSIEMTARDLRYEWFHETGKEYDYIVTAHHANDNAETLLLNLARGTGLKGLTGIPGKNGKIIRPLLRFSSSEIKEYAVQNALDFREDKSNFSEEFNRNKIRLSVIPKLEEIHPEWIPIMSHNIQTFRKQYAFFQDQIDLIREKILLREGSCNSILIDKLSVEKHAGLILYEILKDFGFNAATCDDIFQNLHAEPGKQFYSKTHKVLKDRKMLIISEVSAQENNPVIIISNQDDFKKWGFSIELKEYQPDMIFDTDKNCLYADAAKLSFPLILRNWEQGDFFYPLGMKGKKKISDFFTDLKVDLNKKRQIKLLCHQDNIVWIVGYRADNRYKIENKTTKKYYLIRYDDEHL